MSSAFQKRPGGAWYLGYKDETGKQVQVRSNATSEREARKLATQAELRAEKIRLGIEEAVPINVTFAALAERYTPVASAKRSHRAIKSRLQNHLLPEFGDQFISQITSADVVTFLEKKKADLSLQSVEHLRRLLRAMFNFAISARLLKVNPVTGVAKVKIPKRDVRFLEADQIVALLGAARDRWRCFIAVAIYCGLRKGELVGLRVEDVDLKQRLLKVRHSYDGTTKSGDPRKVPIPDELLPYLKMELGRVRSTFLFSRPDGRMLSIHTDTADLIRRALCRAGIIEGFDHKCRRGGCGHVERHQDDELRKCPACNMTLWPKPVAIKFTFHNLRSTYGTHLYEATGDLRVVQKTLGHHHLDMTEKYSAVRSDRLVEQANKLRFGSSPALPRDDSGEERGPSSSGKLEEGQDVTGARDTGFEPVAFGSGGHRHRFDSFGHLSQPVVTVANGSTASLAALVLDGIPWSAFSSPALPAGMALAIVSNSGDVLLSVKAVARRLSVSTATVYRLCKTGEVPCVRLGASVRIRASDLDQLVQGEERHAGEPRDAVTAVRTNKRHH